MKHNDTKWIETYNEFKDFLITHGRKPSQYSLHKKEVSLFAWMASYRALERNNQYIPPYRVKLIRKLPKRPPTVKYKPPTTQSHKWMNRYEELQEYIKIHNQYPTPKTNNSLAVWVYRQKQSKRKQGVGVITPHQIELLEKIPKWTWDKWKHVNKQMNKLDT